MRLRDGIPLFVILSMLVPASGLAIPVHVWSDGFGDSAYETGRSVAIDAAGNVVLVGDFEGTVDFGGGPLASAGFRDVCVAKFDPAGNHLWSKRFGDAAAYQDGFSVAIDGSGNIFMAGAQGGTVDYGGGPLVANTTDVAVVKLNSSGAHVWSKLFGGPSSQFPSSIAVDGLNNVLITGGFVLTLDFGCGTMTDFGGYDGFVAKLTTFGTCVWSMRFGDTSFQYGYDVTADLAGHAFITGEFSGTVDFGGGPLTSVGLSDIFLAKFDIIGGHVWSKRFGSVDGADYGSSVAGDAAGHVSLVSNSTHTVDLGGGPLVAAGGSDVMLADYDASGTHVWSQRFGDAAEQAGRVVRIDSDGSRILFGHFDGIVDFGTGPLTADARDLFLARFSSAGGVAWATSYGATDSQTAYGLAVNSGKIAVTGENGGTVDFGGGDITSAAPGSTDIYVARFSDDGNVPVLISSFKATPRDAGIDLRWSMSHDEELSSFSLYRRDEDSPQPVQVAGGEFVDVAGSYFDAKVAPGTTYHYELVIRARSGDEFRSPIATATTPGLAASLGQNHPNPFNPSTSIEYSVTERTPVVVGIYDATGALVVRLDEGVRDAGTYRVQWNGRDAADRAAGSGVYFYRLEGSRDVTARKMMLLK